ncbi:MAG: efflux RND transporter periplasmic adaptor subunit [Spirochaetia bacterium]|nr:efflux RND transporter periplasmic adaptor subunit [Spirochaetia bacterium]
MNEHTTNKKKVGLIILLVIIVVAVSIIILNPFAKLKALNPLSGKEEAKTSEKVAIAVSVTPVLRSNLQNYIGGNGNVVDPKALDVYPEVMGNLSYLDAKVGDKVEKDKLLARIDPSRAGVVYKESEVKAPVSGTILAVNFAKGASVSAQGPLFRIGMLEALEVEMDIAERYVGSVRVGTQAMATFKAYPGQEFSGEVTRLSPVLNPTSRTLEIGLRLEDPARLIKSGMFPSVTIFTEKLENVLLISRSSVLYDGNQAYVYVVGKSNLAEKKLIQIGLVVDDKAEVLSGLAEGQKVITQGQTLLTDGTSVRIVE